MSSLSEMERRQFLVLAGSAALGAAASNAFAAADFIMNPDAAKSAPASIGYWNGLLFRTGSIEGSSGDQVVSADSVPPTDTEFGWRPARFTVDYLSRPNGRGGQPISISLIAYYDASTCGKVPFQAWNFTAAPRVRSALINRVRFDVPVGTSRTVDFELETRPPRTDATKTLVIDRAEGCRSVAFQKTETKGSDVRAFSLTLNAKTAGPRLRRGTYFIAVPETSADPVPVWSNVHVDTSLDARERNTILYTLGGPVNFSYIVVSVDYA